MIHKKKKNSGFVAIIIAVIVGIVLILMSLSMATMSYYAGIGGVDIQKRDDSYVAAFSCFDTAWYKLSDDLDYLGNETIAVGSNSCHIDPITSQGAGFVIITTSTVDRNTTQLRGVLNEFLQLTSFEEI
jgi:hypothetical protein